MINIYSQWWLSIFGPWFGHHCKFYDFYGLFIGWQFSARLLMVVCLTIRLLTFGVDDNPDKYFLSGRSLSCARVCARGGRKSWRRISKSSGFSFCKFNLIFLFFCFLFCLIIPLYPIVSHQILQEQLRRMKEVWENLLNFWFHFGFLEVWRALENSLFLQQFFVAREEVAE